MENHLGEEEIGVAAGRKEVQRSASVVVAEVNLVRHAAVLPTPLEHQSEERSGFRAAGGER